MTRAAKHHAAFGLHLAMSLFLFWSWGCSEVNGAAGDADAHADPDADAPWDLDLLAEIDGDGHPCDPCGGEWDVKF